MFRHKKFLILALSCLSLTVFRTADAQTQSTVESSQTNSAELFISGPGDNGPELNLFTPTQVVNSSENTRRVTALPELLRGASNVHVQSTTPGQATPFVRGLTGSAVLNLVDGHRLNHSLYRSAPNPDLALIDAEMVDTMEILYGPQSVRYGSDAMGGVVSVKTRLPGVGKEEQHAGLRTTFNTAELLRSVHADIESSGETFGLLGGVTALETGNRDRGGSGDRLGESAYSSYAGSLTAVSKPTANAESTARLQFLRQPESPRFDELVAGYGQVTPNSSLFNFKPLERIFVQGEHTQHHLLPQVMDELSFKASYQRTRDDREQRDFEGTSLTNEENRGNLFELSLDARADASEETVLSYGIDGTFDLIQSSKTALEDGVAENIEKSPRYPDNSRASSVAVYTLVEQDLTDSLAALGGLRYSNYFVRIPETAEVSRVNLQFDDVTWSAGLRWNVDPEYALVSSVSRGFRAPNIFDLGTLGARPGNRFNIPNADLKPEELYTTELGVEHSSRELHYDLRGFASLYNDKIDSVITGDTTEDGRIIVQSENIAEARIFGAQSSLQYSLCSNFDLLGNFTWTWGEERRDSEGRPLDRIPPLFGSLALRWLYSDTFSVEPYLQFAAKQNRLSERDRVDPRVNPEGTSDWLTTGIGFRSELSENFAAVLRFDNLGDVRYREHGSGIDSLGRNVMLSLDARI